MNMSVHPEPGSLYGSMAVVAELPALGSRLRQLSLFIPPKVTEQHLDPLGMMIGLEQLKVYPSSHLDLSMPSCISRLTNLRTLKWLGRDKAYSTSAAMASYHV